MENDLLSFNFPLKKSSEIELEKKIKQKLRDLSFNLPEPREIQRYTDKYISETNYEAIMATVSRELTGPELVKMYGVQASKSIAKLTFDERLIGDDNDEDEKSSEVEEVSLEGGDDYEVYENDDELIEEEREEKEAYF